MCIAAPAKIVEIDTESNICAADFGGVRQNAKLDLLPDAEIGDYVDERHVIVFFILFLFFNFYLTIDI